MTKNSISLGRAVAGVCMILAIAAVIGLLGSFAPSSSNKGGAMDVVVPDSPTVNNGGYVVDEDFVPSATTIYAGTYMFGDDLEIPSSEIWEDLLFEVRGYLPDESLDFAEVVTVYDAFRFTQKKSDGDWQLDYCYYGGTTLQNMAFAVFPGLGWDSMYWFYMSIIEESEEEPPEGFVSAVEALKGYGQVITVLEDTEYTDEDGLAFVSWFNRNAKRVNSTVAAIDSPTTVSCIPAVDFNMCYVSTNKKGLLCA